MMHPGFWDPSFDHIAPLLRFSAWWGAFGVLGCALLLGFHLLPGLKNYSHAECWLVRVVAGLVGLWLVVLAVGQWPGLLHKIPWNLPAVAGWLLLVGSAGQSLWKKRPSFPEEILAIDGPNHRLPWHRLNVFLSIVGSAGLLWFLFMLLFPAFRPPINYDVLEYHQGFVTHILHQGQITPIPHIFYTAQPMGTELLYTLASLIEGTAWGFAPGVLHWLFILLLAAMLWRIGKQINLPLCWRPLLIAFLLTRPIIFVLQLDRLTDLMGMLMLAGGLLVGLKALQNGSPPLKTSLVLGLFAAGGLGSKWTHAGTVVLPLILFAAYLGLANTPIPGSPIANMPVRNSAFRRKLIQNWRPILASTFFCGLITFLLWLPWGLWLWADRQNPVAPFLANLFPSEKWRPEQLQFLLETHGSTKPWALEYWSNLLARLWVYWPVPLGLAAAPLAAGAHWVQSKKSPQPSAPAADYALIGLFTLAGWVGVLLWGQLLHAADRFLAPVLLLATLNIGLAGNLWLIRQTSTKTGGDSFRLAAGAALLLLLTWPMQRLQQEYILESGAGAYHIHSQEYWQGSLGLTAQLFNEANKLPVNARILAINEARRYPFMRDISLSSVFDVNPIRPHLKNSSSAEDLRRQLLASGYTHLLVNEFEQDRLLWMHTPPPLMQNSTFQTLIKQKDNPSRKQALARNYWGYTEFATEPLTPSERVIYGEFFRQLRQKPIWIEGMPPANQPAMWIAKL